IDSLSKMQLSSTSRKNQREKKAISSIHRDNIIKKLLKYQNNAIVANINDYYNIHGLRMPTTTSTKQFLYSEEDLLNNLTIHCYNIDIHEKRKDQQL
ncbi:8729_t:CDS:2, partial [Funneliformis geosporum]